MFLETFASYIREKALNKKLELYPHIAEKKAVSDQDIMEDTQQYMSSHEATTQDIEPSNKIHRISKEISEEMEKKFLGI